MYRRDRNKHGGGVLCYVNENIPYKMLSVEGVPDDCEIILIKFSIKTQKWLCIGLYKPPSQTDKYFLDNLLLILNKLNCQFDNIILMGISTSLLKIKTLTFL